MTALVGEPLRQWLYRAKLTASFGRSEDYISPTPEKTETSEYKARYVRVRVANPSSRTARGCRAYLVGIEREIAPGVFNRTLYSDTIPLPWSVRPNGYAPEDIPAGVACFLDLVSTREISTKFHVHALSFPFRYHEILKDHATYRFTVQVAADNAKPTHLQIVFRWSGEWDTFEALPAPPVRALSGLTTA